MTIMAINKTCSHDSCFHQIQESEWIRTVGTSYSFGNEPQGGLPVKLAQRPSLTSRTCCAPARQQGSERNTICKQLISICIHYKYNVYDIVMIEHNLHWGRPRAAKTSRRKRVLLPIHIVVIYSWKLRHREVHRGWRSSPVQYKIVEQQPSEDKWPRLREENSLLSQSSYKNKA